MERATSEGRGEAEACEPTGIAGWRCMPEKRAVAACRSDGGHDGQHCYSGGASLERSCNGRNRIYW